jgi:hypothetical protein
MAGIFGIGIAQIVSAKIEARVAGIAAPIARSRAHTFSKPECALARGERSASAQIQIAITRTMTANGAGVTVNFFERVGPVPFRLQHNRDAA